MNLVTVSGPPSSGKTSIILKTIDAIRKRGLKVGVVKFDCLYTDDDILVKVPNGILNENINLNENLHHINLSNNKVDIKLYNNFLSSKQIYLILAVSLLFSIIEPSE